MRLRIYKFVFLFSALLLTYDVALSQKVTKVKKTIRAEMLLPKPVSSRAFVSVFSGVFNLNVSMNFGFNNFNIAPYYGLMQCQIFPRLQTDPHTIQTVHSAGFRFSYDIYPSKEKMQSRQGNFVVISPFLASGFDQVDYSRLKCIVETPSHLHSQTYNIFAGANFNLMFTEMDGIGFTLGYNYLNHHFDPNALCLNEYYSFTEEQKQGLAGYILFGFNIYIDLAKRPDSSE